MYFASFVLKLKYTTLFHFADEMMRPLAQVPKQAATPCYRLVYSVLCGWLLTTLCNKSWDKSLIISYNFERFANFPTNLGHVHVTLYFGDLVDKNRTLSVILHGIFFPVWILVHPETKLRVYDVPMCMQANLSLVQGVRIMSATVWASLIRAVLRPRDSGLRPGGLPPRADTLGRPSASLTPRFRDQRNIAVRGTRLVLSQPCFFTVIYIIQIYQSELSKTAEQRWTDVTKQLPKLQFVKLLPEWLTQLVICFDFSSLLSIFHTF